MKILLDENIDVRFKTYLTAKGLNVFTVKEMKWTGLKNGELLELIKENGFDCWIVIDKNIQHQQNTAKLPCLVIVLDVYRNSLKHLLPFVTEITKTVQQKTNNKLIILKED